ncbi:natterin-3-like [Centropristis striata]|uniref:natterin-3-like n=1 Tax=Centropristis striata TaxID=184440 RepID=UPI0027DFEB65|nr:natterin-3-like [Centropristis striata]
MMKLLVLLLLALPALFTNPVLSLDPSLGGRVPNITANNSTYEARATPVEIDNELSPPSLFKFEQTNLEWQTFNGSIPNGAILIHNDYAKRVDYVCQFWCLAGFYNPDMGPYCHYSDRGNTYVNLFWPFKILVNKDNFEIMEWKDGSYGSVPQNSVYTCIPKNIYVGKNEYGLGKVDVKDKVFYLPWGDSEYWYNTYQVLTFDTDIDSEHIYDVKYETAGVQIVQYPPEAMDKSTITNHESEPVTGTATLSKTIQVEHKWDTSFSITVGVKTSVTAGIPIIGSVDIEFSVETTVELTWETTYIESITHTVSVQYNVPANHSCTINMVGYKYGADIPYTARLSRTYSDGQTTGTSISGNYSSIQVGEVQIVADPCVPVPEPTPSP